jgi:Fe-S oxidoreductase
MKDRTKKNPGVIKDLRMHRYGLENAAEYVEKMIDDLKKFIYQIDVHSEYRSGINALKKEISSLIAEVKAKGYPELVETLNKNLQWLQKSKRWCSAAVTKGRKIVRDFKG